MGDVIHVDFAARQKLETVPDTEPAPAPAPEPSSQAGGDAEPDWEKAYAALSDGELQREFERLGGAIGSEVGEVAQGWLAFFAEPEKPGESTFSRFRRFFL